MSATTLSALAVKRIRVARQALTTKFLNFKKPPSISCQSVTPAQQHVILPG